MMRAYIEDGRIPWPHTEIVQALMQAAGELLVEGWAPVKAAVEWVKRHFPDEAPDGYGCRTWPEVLHKSGVFELQTRRVEGIGERWYRPRSA